MRLTAEIEGQSEEVQLRFEGARVFAEVGGHSYELQMSRLRDGVYLLNVGGRIFECRVEGDSSQPEMLTVNVGARSFPVTLIDPKRLRAGQSAGAQFGGAAQLSAAMPGKVVRVLVAEGEQVEAGQSIVVVEAMKMQNEMKSPRSGIVKTLSARAGATVGAGEVLVVIE